MAGWTGIAGVVALCAGAVSYGMPAQAQDASDSTSVAKQPDQTLASTAAPSTPSAPAPKPASDGAAAKAARDAAKFATFDKLMVQGKTTDYPGTYETIDQDLGGYRTWLYDHNLYFRGSNSASFGYDVASGKSPQSPQVFNGQKFTYINSLAGELSWKIGGSGNDITQLNLGGTITSTNWESGGPPAARFSLLGMYSSFFDRTIEVKAGYSSNLSDFVGIFAGGNPILANGLSGTIPVEAGLSGSLDPAPTFNLALNGKNGLYSKTGVQRSVEAAGSIEETLHNGIGLRFTQPGAGPLMIEEVGVRRATSPQGRQIWLRVGGIYNTTEYTRLDGFGKERNWAAYALADYQLTQPSKSEPYRGIYVGASALFAPDHVNAYTRSYEARVYALGMVPGRPTDQMTLTVDYNRFSRSGGEALTLEGLQTHRSQFSVGALYAYHLIHGIFVSPSIAYISNPSFTGSFAPAVTASTSVAILF